jgi:hypothetical protein
MLRQPPRRLAPRPARLAAGLVLLVWSGVAACARKSPSPPAADTPGTAAETGTRDARSRWVTEDELAAWRREAEAEADANRVRRCPRPPLRGDPLPDPADDDLAAFVEPPDDLAECVDTVQAVRTELLALRHPVDEPPQGLPRRLPGWWRALDDPGLPVDAIRRVEQACAGLPDRLRRAVSHDDACSPYAPGRRRVPSVQPPVRLAQALEVLAREALAAGRPDRAADLALDTLRLGQDLRRGPVSWLVAVVSLVFTETAAGALQAVLDLPGALPDGLAARLSAELEQLAATEPHPAAWIDGDALGTVLQELLPVLAEPGWEPPGGRNGARERRAPILVARGLPAADQAALGWAGLRRIREAFRAACPPDTAVRACVDGLLAAGRGLGAAAREPAGVAALEAELRDAGVDERTTAALRERVVAVIAGVGAPLLARQAPRLLGAPLWLAELRLSVAFRRLAEATGGCPGAADFTRPPLSAIVDPTTGGPLAVVAGPEPGILVVRPELPLPRLEETRAPADPGPVLALRCPLGSPPDAPGR